MSHAIGQATHEAGGWRGQIVDGDGTVFTRTVNLYPTADKAIAAALRLRDHQQRRQPAPGDAA